MVLVPAGSSQEVDVCSQSEHDHSSDLWDEETVEWYVRNYGDHPTNRMAVRLARLEPNDVVVDIGCGSGEAIREAALRVTLGRAIGIDPTPAMIRFSNELSVSHEGRARIEFLQGPVEQIPLPDSAATVEMAINSLHHWEDVQAGLAEVLRILQPGGQFLVSEEELEDGQFGHGDGQLSDPASVMRTIRGAGFVEVNLSQHSDGEVSMLTVAARRAP